MRPPAAAFRPSRELREDELFGCLTLGLRENFLPLHESEIFTTIVSGTFKTVLTQTFINSVSLEDGQRCAYRLPLYDSVSVVGFKCKIGSDCLNGWIKGKKQADVIYDATVAKGDIPGVMEQISDGPNLFVTRIGHVPFGERVHVEITYIGELKQDVECIRFRIPAWIASCSIDQITGRNITSKIMITVDIILPEGQIIKAVESTWHAIAVSTGIISTAPQEVPTMNRASATLSNLTTGLDKDFVLVIRSDDIKTPYALLETHPNIPNHRALLVSLISQFSPPDSLSPLSEIVFVADLSSSMRNDIPMLSSALKVFLKSLSTNVKFNILSLGNKSDFLWSQSKDYNKETLQEAMQYIETLDAGYGPRKLFEAIQATIESRLSEMPLEIILVTGEKIGNQEPLLPYLKEQVENSQQNIRMSCLGIGNTVVLGLVERISRVGSGLCRCVQSGERLDASVVHMLRGALSPHLGDAVFSFKYDEDDDIKLVDEVTDETEVPRPEHEESSTSSSPVHVSKNKDTNTSENFYPKIIQVPHRMPGIFADVRTTVHLLMCLETIRKPPATITLRHSSYDGPPIIEIPIQVLKENSATIHQLAARAAIRDIEESRGWMYDQTTSETQSLAEKESVRLGETFHIINKWCSFIAVRSSDKDILDQQTFPSNLSDVNSASTVIPRTLKPSEMKSDVAFWTARYAEERRLIMKKRAIRAKERREPLSPVNLCLQSSANDAGPRGLSATPETTVLPLKVTRPPPVSPRLQLSRDDTKTRSSYVAKNITLPIIRPPVPVIYPLSNTMSVLALIDLQSFDGSWDADSETLSSILGFEIPKPRASLAIDIDVWVTMLVVRFLEDSIPEENNVWFLVVEKARRYVRTNLDTNSDMVLLEKMAAATIHSS